MAVERRRRRICLCTDSLEPSGVGEHMLTLATALRGRWDVTLSFRPTPATPKLMARAADAGLRLKLFDVDQAMADWLSRSGFALLHVHAGIGWEGHALAQMGRAAGIACVIRTEHLPYVITDPDQARAHADGMRQVDRVVCVSRAATRSLVEAGVAAAKLATIHNGVGRRPATRDRAETRRSLGIAADAALLIMVARFTAQKGHATLVAALPKIRAERPSAHVLLVGAGPGERDVRDQVARTDASGAVSFLGVRDDVPDLLAAADLLVLPSFFEGLPLVVLEAMASGLPVVASRIGGNEEAVLDGITGRLFAAGDSVALADAVLATLEDGSARSLGAAGRARFSALFTAERMASATERLYVEAGVSAGMPSTRDHMTRLRIGFIGAGGIAHRHLGVLAQFADVEVTAFADTDFARARDAAARSGARAYATHREMLDAGDLDAVFICVPPFAHGAPERDVTANRLPFFVEKPVAIDLPTAEAIDAEVEKSGLVTAVGYHWRYLDTTEEARGLLADNPAHLLSGYWLDATPPPVWWWRQDRSGGQMVEQATHIIDLARHLAGEIEEVFGMASHRGRGEFPGLDVPTASTASLRFASGAIGNIGSTCLLRWGHRVGLHVFGDGLAIELSEHDIMVDVGRGRPVRRAEGDPVWRQDRDFVDAVMGRENRIRCPYAEAVRTQRVAVAIAESARTGRAVGARTREMVHG